MIHNLAVVGVLLLSALGVGVIARGFRTDIARNRAVAPVLRLIVLGLACVVVPGIVLRGAALVAAAVALGIAAGAGMLYFGYLGARDPRDRH